MPYLTSNGIKLYYETHGEGEPLLLIHGLGSSTRDWENQIVFFSRYYRVIVFDLRGHGKTEKPKGPYSVSQFTYDTASLLSILRERPAHIVGHSLGGMIAFQLVLDFPDAVKSLTVVNSAPRVSFPTLAMRLSFYLRKWSVRLFGMAKLSTALANNLFPKETQQKEKEIFVQRCRENNTKAYLSALAAFPHWNVEKRLAEIEVPTLIVTADQDYTSVDFKKAYVHLIKNAALSVIAHSRHMTPIDQPAAFNKVLFNFLTSRV